MYNMLVSKHEFMKNHHSGAINGILKSITGGFSPGLNNFVI